MKRESGFSFAMASQPFTICLRALIYVTCHFGFSAENWMKGVLLLAARVL